MRGYSWHCADCDPTVSNSSIMIFKTIAKSSLILIFFSRNQTIRMHEKKMFLSVSILSNCKFLLFLTNASK